MKPAKEKQEPWNIYAWNGIYRNAAEIMLLMAAILLCTRFPQYIPTTPDDYSSLFNGWASGWMVANRLSWLITEPFSLFVNRNLFSIRETGGLHIAFFLAPTITIYGVLRHQGLLKEARLGACILLATQVLGYDHTTPLAYPIVFSTANAISIGTGFALGKLTQPKNQGRKGAIAKITICLIMGSIAGLWYEYFPLLFFTSTIWGALSTSREIDPTSSPKHNKPGGLKRLNVLLMALAPALVTLGLKLTGWIIGKDIGGFNNYQGNTIPISAFSIKYLATTAIVSAKTLINSTIAGNSKYLLSVPPQKYTYLPSFPVAIFSALLAFAAVTSLAAGRAAERDTNHRDMVKQQVIALASLASITLEQLIINSMTSRHHAWFASSSSSGSWSRTYLNASMAVTTAAYIVSILVVMAVNWRASKHIYLNRSWQKLVTTSASITIGLASYMTMSHNMAVAKIVQDRSNSLEQITTTCYQGESAQELNKFAAEPPERLVPFAIHTHEIDKESGNTINTICRDALAHPRLFEAWNVSKLNKKQMNDLRRYGVVNPTPADWLKRFATIELHIEQSPNNDTYWTWVTTPNANSMEYSSYMRLPKGWTAKIIPAPAYSMIEITVSGKIKDQTKATKVYGEGIKLDDLLGQGDELTITEAISKSKFSEKLITPLPLSDGDDRKAFFRIEISKP